MYYIVVLSLCSHAEFTSLGLYFAPIISTKISTKIESFQIPLKFTMNRFLHLTLSIIWLFLNPFFFISRLLFPRKKLSLNTNELIVIITGCDSGIGNLLAKELIKCGYVVIATCLTKEGGEQLEKEVFNNNKERLHVVQCDVTKSDDIKQVEAKLKALYKQHPQLKLWSIVNNAGIATCGFVDWMTMDSARKVFDVNFFSILTMSQTFLPYLKEVKRSRIINISSAAGFASIHNGGIYCG